MGTFPRAGLLVIAGVFTLFLQGTLKYYLPGFESFIPNLSLGVLVYLGFYEATVLGAFLAFFLGLELDLAIGTIIGPWAGAYVAVFGVLSSLSQRVFVETFITAFFALLFSSLFAAGVYALVTFEAEWGGAQSLVGVLIETVATALIAPVVLLTLRGIIPRTQQRHGRLRSF